MNETTDETTADIIADMRCLGLARWASPSDIKEFADRLEAAAKRERNAAAMREALEAVRDLLLPQCNGGTAFAKACGETVNKILDALSAPPRNCDRFDDLNSAQRHYIEHGCPKGLGMIVDGEIRKFPWKSQFEKWLFALATEQKGESNGSK